MQPYIYKRYEIRPGNKRVLVTYNSIPICTVNTELQAKQVIDSLDSDTTDFIENHFQVITVN